MPDADLYMFFISSLLLALAPGPDNLYVLSQSSQHGRAAGGWVTLGLCTGLLGHTAAVALGLAALLKASPTAYLILKILGAAYLVYLGLLSIRSAGRMNLAKPAKSTALQRRKLYARGIIMNVTNPKVTIFFLAFLPQFTQPEHGHVAMQILMLGGLFMLATLLVFGAISLLAGGLRDLLGASSRLQKMLAYLTSLLFFLLAFRIVITG